MDFGDKFGDEFCESTNLVMNKVTISRTFLVTNFVKNLEMARELDGRYGKTKGWFWTKCV